MSWPGRAPLTASRVSQSVQIRVAAIGDSTLYNSGGCGWFEYACALSNGRMVAVINAGINGNSTTQMAARFATDVIAFASQLDVVFLYGVVNDQGAGIPRATTLANYQSMIQQALAAGLRPIIVAAPPFNNSTGFIIGANNALRVLAQQNRIDFINPWAESIDPATGGFLAGFAMDVTTHPGQKSLRLAGASLAAQMGFAPYVGRLPVANTDSIGINAITNGLFLNGASGTPTGVSAAPAEFTYAMTAGANGVLGNWFDMGFANLTDTFRTVTGPASMTNLAVGDTIRFASRVKTAGFEANGDTTSSGQGKVFCQVSLFFVGAGTSLLLAPSIGADLSGIYEKVGVIPAGTTGLQWRAQLGRRAGLPNVSGMLSLAQMGVFKE